MTTVQKLIQDVIDVRSNPADVQDVVYSAISDMNDKEYDVVDPNNPVAFVIESACYLAVAAMTQNETLSRAEYPILAQNYGELYAHMSDVDYLDRFATPSHAEFQLILSLDEVKQRAVKLDDNTTVLTIPESTRISLDGLSFTLDYAIEIRVLNHGGIQIVYNTDNINPIRTLESNVVEWDTLRFLQNDAVEAGKMLMLTIPANQYRIDVFYDQLNPSTGFAKKYTLNDEFYYCRCWVSEDDSEWREIITTHSDQVYDPAKATALLKVLDGELSVSVPQIYFSNGIIGKNIRIDIYTTKGAVNTSFESYSPSAFDIEWLDYHKYETPANDPIRTFSNMSLYSSSKINSGGRGLTFEELRDRVIYNSLGKVNIPITSAQLRFKLERMGYNILKDTDTLNDRSYLATRSLPKPSGLNFNTEIGSTVKTLNTTLESLATHSMVRDNGDRITINSGALFELVSGRLNIVKDIDLDQIADLNGESLITTYNTNDYFNTLFHYVVDSSDNIFSSRAFYLDDPKILSKEFIAENESTQLEINTQRYAITLKDDGYKLVLVTRGSDLIKALGDDQLHVLLTYIPPGEYETAVLKGTITGRTADGDYMVEFHIGTNFDIDVKNRLFVNTFKMFDVNERNVPMFLKTKFNLIYAVTGYEVEGIARVDIDNLIPNFIMDGAFYTVLQERISVDLGTELETLWSRSRTIAGPKDYLTHDTVVYKTHKDVYATDAGTGLVTLELNQTTGRVERTKLHSEGDFVLVNGEKVVEHAIGSVVKDNNGDPVISSGRQTNRQMDLFLLEGIFKISNDPAVKAFYDSTVDTIVDWITNEVVEVEKKLDQNTDIFFYPKTNMGRVDVFVGSDTPSTMDAEQSFNVKFYLTEQGYQSDELKSVLEALTKSILTVQLSKKTISVTNIANSIMNVSDEAVIAVVVSGLGGSNNYELVTIRDDDVAMMIKKDALVLPDTTITIEDSIVFEWVKHTGEV